MEEVGKVLFLKEGDIFTKNGEFFMEVLTTEMTYVDQENITKAIIGIRESDGFVAYRDAIEVKAMVFRNTDQFPPQEQE